MPAPACSPPLDVLTKDASDAKRAFLTGKATMFGLRACVLAAACAVASTAVANGRFPRAQRLVQSSETSDVLALYGTYGLIVTHDGGMTWRHVCEAATGTYAG